MAFINVKFFFIGLFLLIKSVLLAQNPNDIVGIWLTENKDAKVEIFEAEDGSYSGKMVWMSEPYNEDGELKLDKHNKDESTPKQTILGLVFLEKFDYHERKGKWVKGRIYNIKNGKMYAGTIRLNDEGNLLLRGHLKRLRFLGRTKKWTPTTLE